jgi:hypothetical protein
VIKDLYKYSKEFPITAIPHYDGKQIIDSVHYPNKFDDPTKGGKPSMDQPKPNIKTEDIQKTLAEVSFKPKPSDLLR